MFRAAKDALASEAARRRLNALIARYGEATELTLDSKNKTVWLVCRLDGETEPVSIKIESYEVGRVGDKKVLTVGSCTCSRPWLENLLNDHLRGRQIDLPGWAAAVL